MKKYVLILTVFIFTMFSCSSDGDSNNSNSNSNIGNGNGNGNGNQNSNDWLIPINQVVDGGTGIDGIPSLRRPSFAFANDPQANYLADNDLIVGIKIGDDIRAYSHIVLDWHEIVNDIVDNETITLSYCPLTGTAFVWNRTFDGSTTTFGTSGLLYNANLILYDRRTNSFWSQLLLKSVHGPLIGSVPTVVNIVETNWGAWKALYPNTKVITLNTGFTRSYGVYPYGSYRTNNDFFVFPASPLNSALPNKRRVHAIINGTKSKVYQFSDFTNGNTFIDTFQGKTYLIVGNENIINSFELRGNLASLNFQYTNTNAENFFSDDEGNIWNIFGTAIQGPRLGEQLADSNSVMSYWFAIAAFYPNPEIF